MFLIFEKFKLSMANHSENPDTQCNLITHPSLTVIYKFFFLVQILIELYFIRGLHLATLIKLYVTKTKMPKK